MRVPDPDRVVVRILRVMRDHAGPGSARTDPGNEGRADSQLNGAVRGHGHGVLAVSGRVAPGRHIDVTVFMRRDLVRRETQAACRRAVRNTTEQEWKQYMGGDAYRVTCPDLPTPDPVARPGAPRAG